jgi:hypothetical protein
MEDITQAVAEISIALGSQGTYKISRNDLLTRIDSIQSKRNPVREEFAFDDNLINTRDRNKKLFQSL